MDKRQRALTSSGHFSKTLWAHKYGENSRVYRVCFTDAVEDGAIRIVARAAERTASVDVVRLCASTLCNFAGDGRARPKMSDSRTAQVGWCRVPERVNNVPLSRHVIYTCTVESQGTIFFFTSKVCPLPVKGSASCTECVFPFFAYRSLYSC